MADKFRTLVRKLLAMASDPGASDNERGVAMAKAQRLIEEHNIELGDLDNFEETIKVVQGDRFAVKWKLPYHRVVFGAVAELYECRHLMWKLGANGHSFWGMSHQVEAAEETAIWIIAQIEDLYRVALKAFDGQLSKTQRAELRASFKDAAAARVVQRIFEIIAQRRINRDSRALVVVNTAKQKLDEMVKEGDIKSAKAVALREGFGTGAGYNAGAYVQIQKGMGGSNHQKRIA